MPDETFFDQDYPGKRAARRREHAIARLAGAQHGVVSRTQLEALGLTRGAIEHRIGTRRLLSLHRGVYAVGHRGQTSRARWMAAVLAAGRRAVLSHRSAGALHSLTSALTPVEVIVPCRIRSRRGLRTHEIKLPDDEITEEDSIPVTTPARTLFDLAAALDIHHLEAAIAEAERRRLSSPTSLADLLERYPGRRGTGNLRTILASRNAELGAVAGELETRFLALLDRHGIARPLRNVPIQAGGRTYIVDCVWRKQGVIVELDGRAFHGNGVSFDADRERDRALLAAGWVVIRITWRQLVEEPERVAADIRRVLHRAARSHG